MNSFLRSRILITGTCFISLFGSTSNAQFQIGSDIYGSTNNELSGYSLSMPYADFLAVGAPWNGDTIYGAGRVQVLRWDGLSWGRKGQNIYGLGINDRAGHSISMPDTNTIAIGSPLHDTNFQNTGMVRVYHWNGLKWKQKGNTLVGDSVFQQFGQIVMMPDSNTLAVISRDSPSQSRGDVRVYAWSGANWIQKGTEIPVFYPWEKKPVAMPDPNTIALYDDTTGVIPGTGINFYGRIVIYEWDGNSWVINSVPVYKSTHNGWRFGSSLYMPNNSTICVTNSEDLSNFADSMYLGIYSLKGGVWSQKGSFIPGYNWSSDWFGYDLSMPDSNTLAIGAPKHDNPARDAGMVQIYKWQNHSWIKSSSDILGDTLDDNLGYALSMPDPNTIAIAAPWNDGMNGNNLGQVKVFRYCDTIYKTYGTDVKTACNHYIWIDGNKYDTSNYSASYSLLSGSGCDSIVTLNLTIVSVDTSVSVNNSSLSSNAVNAQYQWLTCGNSYDSIPGAVSQSYSPDSIGSYAVMVTQNNCTAISACYFMGEVGLQEQNQLVLEIYPNPTRHRLTIKSQVKPEKLRIYNATGKLILEATNSVEIELPQTTNGLLILEIELNGQLYRERILKLPKY